VRLAIRVSHDEVPPAAGLPPWQTQTAWIVYWLLYAMLFVVPILGWLNASYRGMPIAMFGIELPKLLATRAPGWAWTGDVHGLLSQYACCR
jgi:cytochrome b561